MRGKKTREVGSPGSIAHGRGTLPRPWTIDYRRTREPSIYASTLMTTRLFCARPSRVLFGATGFSSPKLITLILCNGI